MSENSSGNQERLILIILGIAALYGLFVLTGMGVNRAVCGPGGSPDSLFGPLGFFSSGDTTVFGTTDGCTAPTAAVVATLVGVLVVVAVLVGVGFWARAKWKQSDRAFLKDLRRREGIARASEVRRTVGTRSVSKRVGKVRPSLKHPKPVQGALKLGVSEGSPVWASLEESVCLIGPPRSGKGLHLLVGAILDAPGPVITTSSRADNLAMTWDLRKEKGPVALFDPQGLTGRATTLKWSPITGCERPMVANQRATSLIGASGLGASSGNQEWRAPATTIMECLLHAAALGRRTVDDLMRWGNNPMEAKEAVRILSDHPSAASNWNLVLQGIIEGDPKLLQNKWFGVEGAVKGLAVPEVRAVLNPARVDETFDIDRFLTENGTLYIVGTKTGGSSAGPFLIAMMDAITERARELAAKSPGNRLDPPLSLVLDEIANISGAWPGLTQLMADGGGVGISVFAVFQSLAQARNEWGEQQATALFDSATVKIQLGGASNVSDLETFSKLAGSREITRFSKSRSKDSVSTSEQVAELQVLNISDLRRLPFGWGILFNRNGRPIVMQMTKWPDRADAKQIKAAAGAYNQALLSELLGGDDVLSSGPSTRDVDVSADLNGGLPVPVR